MAKGKKRHPSFVALQIPHRKVTTHSHSRIISTKNGRNQPLHCPKCAGIVIGEYSSKFSGSPFSIHCVNCGHRLTPPMRMNQDTRPWLLVS